MAPFVVKRVFVKGLKTRLTNVLRTGEVETAVEYEKNMYY